MRTEPGPLGQRVGIKKHCLFIKLARGGNESSLTVPAGEGIVREPRKVREPRRPDLDDPFPGVMAAGERPEAEANGAVGQEARAVRPKPCGIGGADRQVRDFGEAGKVPEPDPVAGDGEHAAVGAEVDLVDTVGLARRPVADPPGMERAAFPAGGQLMNFELPVRVDDCHVAVVTAEGDETGGAVEPFPPPDRVPEPRRTVPGRGDQKITCVAEFDTDPAIVVPLQHGDQPLARGLPNVDLPVVAPDRKELAVGAPCQAAEPVRELEPVCPDAGIEVEELDGSSLIVAKRELCRRRARFE